MMRRTLRTAVAALLSVGILAGSVLTSSAAFTDVPSTHWAYTYVQKASDNGLVSGIGNGLYGVDNQLSAADFATMVCALLYPGEADALKGKSSWWWYPYMETAYLKGLLTGTTAGDSRSSLGAWRSDVPTQKLTRYDLAQIIYNAQKLQGWPEPNANFIYIYMAAIPDWSQIPTKYQTAVVMAYAGGFLTGMDDKGTFKGDEVMTRGQAAVVLCAMLDAAKEQSSPTYTNRAGKLVNGEDATEENVKDALQDLRSEFYEYYIWDTQRSYTSAKLGTGVGGQGFAFMISDKVFGALPSEEVTKFSQLKPGDLVFFDADDQYAVVTSVNGNRFDYLYCNGFGSVSWKGSGNIDDLGSRDAVYTRYEGEPDDVLANGEDATERNVLRLLDDLMDEYEDGDEWDKRYESDVLGSGRGDEGFAYMISDEIFGDLDVEELDSVYDMRPGDIVYRDDADTYLIVLDVDTSDDTFTYLYLDQDYVICWNDWDWLDMDRYDTVYTRYPADADDDDDDDDVLSNGKAVTEKNVLSILSDLEDDYDGDDWAEDDRYRSDVLGTGYGSQGFAYFISDEIFGDLDVSKNTKFTQMKAGDILYYDYESAYVIILDVDTDRDEFSYAYADEYRERVYWDQSGDLNDLDSRYDTVYTRYP